MKPNEIFRSRLGNILLGINLAIIIRALLVACANPDVYFYLAFFRELPGTFIFLSPVSFPTIPTSIAIAIVEWVLRPLLVGLEYENRYRLEVAAFCAGSSLQWLLTGYLIENAL